ncbi:zinc-dependent metalloprotease family protein [Cupriavidus basilensis]
MATHSTHPSQMPPASYPELTLKPGGAVCKVAIPLRPLRIYFQLFPGISRTEAERGLAGLSYKLRIPGQTDSEGTTEANGKILLPGLQPGITGELEILGTLIQLTARDYSDDEKTDSTTTMGIQGAKRRLMVLGYYDKPYRSVRPGQVAVSQIPDDKLDHIEIEDAILRFQVDSGIEPNGEIERHELAGSKIDPSQAFGFHRDLTGSNVKQFHPDFVAKLAAGGGSAPPGTMEPCTVPPPPRPKHKGTVGSAKPGPSPKPLAREIYDGHRFVPVRFVRYNESTTFHPGRPELDERGYREHDGPIVSLMAGQRIDLLLLRLHVGASVPLSFVSTDESTVKISQATGDLIELTGIAGLRNKAEGTTAAIEVRYGSPSGPLLHTLAVQVYAPINVAVAVHFVSIGQAGKPEIPRIPPSLQRPKLEPIFNKINDIWRAAGIRFEVKQWLNDTIDLTQAGAMTVKPAKDGQPAVNEFHAVTSLNRKARHLNMYVVESTIGSGIGWGLCNTALVAAEQMHGGQPSSQDQLIQTFAHEIGHFLGLWHPATHNPEGDDVHVQIQGREERHNLEDFWSRRMLMYVYTGLNGIGPLDANTRQRGRQQDVGNGWHVGGKMLCCKTVPKVVSSPEDSEIVTARGIALLNKSESSTEKKTAWSPPSDNAGQGVFA